MTLANSRTDKAYIGSQAAKIETHPERRFKAAVCPIPFLQVAALSR